MSIVSYPRIVCCNANVKCIYGILDILVIFDSLNFNVSNFASLQNRSADLTDIFDQRYDGQTEIRKVPSRSANFRFNKPSIRNKNEMLLVRNSLGGDMFFRMLPLR